MQENSERDAKKDLPTTDSPQTEPPQKTEATPTQPPQQTEQTELPPKKKKKHKEVFVADGHTVYSMEALTGKIPEKKDRPELTWKERFALIRAVFATYFPPFLIVLCSFALVGLLLYFWLI